MEDCSKGRLWTLVIEMDNSTGHEENARFDTSVSSSVINAINNERHREIEGGIEQGIDS
jgi:hypothetical protein